MEHVFVLEDLLAHESLGLSLLTGGPDALRRPVSGAHAIEIEHAARWLAPGWVMLTTGVALRRHPETQRTLIGELQSAHVSALGFGVEVVFRRIPPALREEADARGFPVFEIPLKTPFREVIASVNRSLVGGEMRTYQRLSSVQLYLVDALGHDHPQRTVLERLASLLDATVIVFDIDGEPCLATGEAPTKQLWAGITERADALIAEFDAEDWHAVAAPVVRSGVPSHRWLAVATPRAGFSTRLAKLAVQATAPLLAAVARLDDLAREQELAVRSALLDEALVGGPEGDGRALAARAAARGVDFGVPAHVVLIERRPTSGAERPRSLSAYLAALEDELARCQLPHLATSRPGCVIALVQQESDPLRTLLSSLTDASGDLVVGIGRPVREIAGVAGSYRDAQLAAARAQGSGAGAIADFSDFDLVTLLVSEVPDDRVRPKVEDYLGSLRMNPGLYTTLAAYFAHDLDVVATAQALHLHPNSLRYRLTRIEKTIGHSLKQPATIAALHVALTLPALIERS